MRSALPFDRGFSLVELVIVVVIIGVIAAIAIPRISRSVNGASSTALRASLSGLRRAIDMYAAEHGGGWPGADGVASTFAAQITGKTDSSGNVGTTAGVHIFGPYLRNLPSLPVGPYPGASGVIMDTNDPMQVSENPEEGWVYDWLRGAIIANTNDLDENGVGYNEY